MLNLYQHVKYLPTDFPEYPKDIFGNRCMDTEMPGTFGSPLMRTHTGAADALQRA
jgi:hypothetical protein